MQPPTTPNSKRVAVYTRISTNEDNQEYSLPMQEKSCKSMIGTQDDWVYWRTFTDQCSGSNLNRPDVQKLLAAAERQEFDILLIHKIDRLTRNALDWRQLLKRLADLDIEIHSVCEGAISTGSRQTKLMADIMAVFGEFERGLIVDRIIAGNREKASQGKWVGGQPPYGYATDSATGVLQVVEADAAIVRRIFDIYTGDALGSVSISQALYDEGVRDRRGNRWAASRVLGMLRNPVYIGKIVHKEEIFDGLHEAIIPEQQFLAAQGRLAARGCSAKRAPDDSTYLFTGLIRCERCGSHYVGCGATGSRQRRYRYYECSRARKQGAAACPAPRLRADHLENVLIDLVIGTYNDTGLFTQAIETANKGLPERHQKLTEERKALFTELNTVEARIARYYVDYEDEKIPKDLVWPRIQELGNQRQALANTLAEIDAELLEPTAELAPAVDLEHTHESLRSAFDENNRPVVRALLSLLVAVVRVQEDGDISTELFVPAVEDQ